MALDSDHVVDRRRLKRHLLMWRVAAIVATVAAVVAIAGGVRELARGDHVARLTVESIIVDDPWREAALVEVAEDSSARALLVRIDSPGGTVVGGEALYLSLRAVAEKKPVIVVMGELATSAGYMIALGANHIVARAGTLTGSIGVIMQSADVTGLLDKLGIKPYSIKSRPLKAQPNPLEPLTEEARQAAKAVVLDFFEFFVDLVAERRDMPREAVLRLADGRVFTGRQALANGLVDQIGGETQARHWLDETHGIAVALPVRDVAVDYGEDFWRDAIGNALGEMLSSERLSLDGLVSLWHPGRW